MYWYSFEHEVMESVGVVELFLLSFLNENADWFPGLIWWTISPLLIISVFV